MRGGADRLTTFHSMLISEFPLRAVNLMCMNIFCFGTKHEDFSFYITGAVVLKLPILVDRGWD